jgi:hypothetical protein
MSRKDWTVPVGRRSENHTSTFIRLFVFVEWKDSGTEKVLKRGKLYE